MRPKSRKGWSHLVAGVALGTLGLSLLAAPADSSPPPANSRYNSFRPGQPWLDTSGKAVQAHGGQVVPAKDQRGRRIYYWYGEDRSNGYYNSPGVHLYSSYDLYNWKDEGLALRAMSSVDQFKNDKYFAKLYKKYTPEQKDIVWRDLSTNNVRTDGWATSSILERPKVIYNKATRKWVMWVHSDGPSSPTSTSNYARAEAGVAIADSPKGPFRWIDSYRLDHVPSDSVPWCGTDPAFDPAGGMARDMNLFVDDDGTAYIIYSSEENRTMYISKLNKSYTYLSASPDNAVQGKDFVRTLACNQREAPAMFKSEGTYYLVTSGATGWDPNPAHYATSQNILDQFTDRGVPITGDGAATTYHSQSTNVIAVDQKQNKFIFMGDRWTPDDLANAPYIWMPMKFGEGGALAIGPDTEWTLKDLTPYKRWTVTSTIPNHVWLNDTSTLPATVTVTTAQGTTQAAVTWDAASIAHPGPATLRGTLADGRTFTRSVAVVPHGLRYAVNAGGTATPDWTRLIQVAATEMPLLNSAPEQPLGTDPGTGATWGYTGASGTEGTAAGDLYTTLRWAKNHEPLIYTFGGLEPGTYTVHAGYYDPWPWANRAAQVTVNGSVVDQQRLFTSTGVAASYGGIQVGPDGKVSVSIAPTRSPDIQVSWLMVARNS
ncbi:family 43 glycosylhydrolase [Kribbella sp. NPDC048928]|uniref:family 43 glycosylhydrolase n=1 Tax=Kribbella sp. NPDC048928 TaxID=3364111 RepID=UPI003717EEBC